MSMNFRCERDAMSKALLVTARATASSTAGRTALTGVHMDLRGDTLTVTGSDLDLTISATTEVAGGSDGTAVTPSRLLGEVVRALPPGSVEFSVNNGEARIVAGSSEFSLRLIPTDDYPQLDFASVDTEGSESAAFGESVSFDGGDFRDALSQVVRSASKDDSRPILTGVLMASEESGLRLVSTDSYRLSVRDLAGSSILGDVEKVLVPSRALTELQRLIADSESKEISLKLAEQYAQFSVGSIQLTTQLIAGDFPNYQGLIPKDHPNRLTASRERLLEAVRRVRLLAQDSVPVRLVMSESNLEVKAITQDVGQANESMSASYSGETLTVAFNPEYLIDGLEAAGADEVVLETADPVKPALLRSVDDDRFLYLLMPVRVS